MNLMQFHKSLLNWSTASPYFLAAQMERQRRIEQIVEIGRISRTIQDSNQPPALAVQEGQERTMEPEVS